MKKLILLMVIALPVYPVFSQTIYFPPKSGEWDTVSTASLGYCQERIDSLYEFLESESSLSFILLKDGKIALEKYFGNHGKDSLWVWFSAGKSLTAALVGIASEKGYLSIHDKTSDYLGKWTTMDPGKEDLITIRHQLTMTTGLDEYDFTCTDSACLIYKADAGTRWYYHNAPYSLLVDVMENATGMDYNVFTQLMLKSKIGMGGFWLPMGYNHFYWSNARSMARFGLLIYAGGIWDGTTVLGDTGYYHDMIRRSQNLNPSYGYLWWLNSADSIIYPSTSALVAEKLAPDAPGDMYAASGAQGQYISISPSKKLVIIRQGLSQGSSDNFLNDLWKYVLALECEPSTYRPLAPGEVTIHPNPANDRIHIDIPAGNILNQAVIYDGLGRVIMSVKGDTTIDISTLPGGHYTVRLYTTSGVINRRFVRL